MDVPTWQLYLQQKPDLTTTGPKITAALTQSQAADIIAKEDSFHLAQLQLNGRSFDWHGEWSMWKGLDLGTRLLLYVVAYRSIEGSDNWDNIGLLNVVLPFELGPALAQSYDKDKRSFFLAQSSLDELTGIYDDLVVRAKTGAAPMTFQDYIAAHPELNAVGRQWTMTMTDAEKAQFAALENQALLSIGPMNGPYTAQTSAEWTEWVKSYPGLRLLYYGGAFDSGLNNAQSITTIFPSSIAQPKNPILAQQWLAWMKLFADMRDKIKTRAAGVALPTTTGSAQSGNGSAVDIPGNSLADTPATSNTGTPPAGAATGGGSSSALWVVLLVLGLLAVTKK